jgi:hypothetical protein
MVAGSVDEGLKRKLLELLHSDWEFRRAVAAELGLLEILERFARLEERFLKLEERVARLEERVEEHSKAIRSLQEEVARHSRAIEKLTDAVQKLASAVSDLTERITAIGHRYGVFTEDAFREAVRFLVEDLLREYRVERWEYYDGEGLVYGHPSMVEADVLIRDREHILVEYKASADRGDVAELYRLGIVYEKATGVKPKLLLVSPAIRRRAAELARKLGVELRGNIVD